jgi:hypothetical protein
VDVTLAGTPLTYLPSDEDLAGVSVEFAAFDGEVGFGLLPVPDQAAALTVATGRACRIEEGSTRLSDGFMLDQDRTRGFVPAGTARLYQFGIVDANALLDGFRVIRSRAAETDYARVMAFAALDGPTWDTTWVINASTVTLPAKQYDADGGWGELITDLVEFTGKTLFLHDKADGSGRCLHYHLLTNGHTSGLTITDVAGAEDRVTVFSPWAPQRTRTSVDLRNDILGRDQSGRTSTATDPTSITAHDADGLQHQALIDFEATSQADLDVKTAAFLASQKDDLDTWTFSIGPMDEDALALIRVGDLIPITSTVMGLSASTQRIAHMTLTPLIGEGGRASPGFWMAALEVGAPVRRRARVRPAVAIPSAPWACVPQDYRVFTTRPTPNMACVGSSHGVGPAVCSSGFATGDTMKLYAGATYRIRHIVYHSPESFNLWASIRSVGAVDGPVVEFGATRDAGILWAPGVPPPVIFGEATYTPSVTDEYCTLLISGLVATGCDNFASSVDTEIWWMSGPDPRFETLPACVNGFPISGQDAIEAGEGDGSTTVRTTLVPYSVGSLRVFVDNTDQTAAVTSSNPLTGSFTLAFALEPDESYVVYYKAA